MTGYHEIGHQPTPDEIFADMAVGYAAMAGVYLEIYPEADYEHGGIMFSAVCLPMDLHDRMLSAFNERYQHEPPKLKPNQPQPIWIACDRLELGIIRSMPSYRTGLRTAAEALRATLATYDDIPRW
jgi:hypothetical protein